MTPTLTVAIPNYNHAHFLERCIGSVMMQERLPDELIVYDDGSTDNSLEVLARLQKRWPLLQIVEGGTNCGVLEGITRLAKRTSSDWVHGLGADDVVLPGFYAQAMSQAERYPDAAILFGAFMAVEEDSGKRWMENADRWIDPGYKTPKEMINNLFMKAPSLFGLAYATLWNSRYYKIFAGKHYELESHWDSFVFRCVGATYGGVYLGPVPGTSILVSSQTYGGKVAARKQALKGILQRAATLMRTEYPDVFPEAYITRWESRLDEELGLTPMPYTRRIKLALPWGVRKLAVVVTRGLGR